MLIEFDQQGGDFIDISIEKFYLKWQPRGRMLKWSALHAASRAEPRLSRDTLLDDAQTRMMEAVAVLRRAPPPGEGIGVRQPARKPLQARAVSAYLDMPGRLPA